MGGWGGWPTETVDNDVLLTNAGLSHGFISSSDCEIGIVHLLFCFIPGVIAGIKM